MSEKVLVIYHNQRLQPQRSLSDHIFSFRRYSDHDVYYLNLFYKRQLSFIEKYDFDLVVIHFTLMYAKEWMLEKYCKWLIGVDLKQAAIAAVFQDEWYKTDILCDLINKMNIKVVFTVCPESEIKKLYNKIDHSKVKFINVLTAYIDDGLLACINNRRAGVKRKIDIGYRAVYEKKRFYHGNYYNLKGRIGELFSQKANEYGISKDISLIERDFLFGQKWYKFLLGCKYVLGIESGVDLIDRDGQLRKKVENYIKKNPDAEYDEVSANCGLGGHEKIKYYALAPRHIEACMTRTCQVLTEGTYNNVLKSGVHYIELKKDFSNLDEVVMSVKEDSFRDRIVEKAYNDVVESGKYSYRMFVEKVFNETEINRRPESETTKYPKLLRFERMSYFKAAVYAGLLYPVYRIMSVLTGESFIAAIRKLFKL